MDRRNFLRVSATGAGLAALGGTALACAPAAAPLTGVF
jgi:hypothetical protein